MERGSLKIGGIDISVDIARNAVERERGLSGRPSLEDGQGMLFVFPKPGRYAFWMKDMRFPIDIVWLRRGVIAAIAHDVPPPSRGRQPETRMPEVEVDAVLEVPAGYAAAHGFGPGMPVEMPL